MEAQQMIFDGCTTEYRRRLQDWGVAKRMVKEDKDAITSALVRRKRPGASVSCATTQHDGKDKPLDYKNLKRHLKGKKPQRLEVAPGLLSSWNLPYAAFVSSLSKNPGGSSPFGQTPDYLHIQSPEALTPDRAAAGPSPKMQLVYEKHKEHCTSFLQGRFDQLVVNLCKEDRSTMVNYFHDFYMHSFILAKDWGRELLNPNPTQAFALAPQMLNAASPWTPSAFLNFSSGPSSPEVSSTTKVSYPLTQLCKWSIHVSSESCVYDDNMGTTSPPNSEPPADSEPTPSSFVDSLHQSMASNDFTTIPKADLPLAQDLIAKSLEEDPRLLQLDAWKLAIMAGNIELLDQLFQENEEDMPEGIEAIHPFHLAAAFLDGGHQCCGMFTTLNYMNPTLSFHNNIDVHGHTILDALVVSVLRSHTSIQPGDVSYGFHSSNRFPGEEKDICGRWDADTPTVRELFKQGYARIPTKWKHPFCHTAVQAVCHSLTTIFASPTSPNINTQSGLFVRRCTECGLELKLGPLHTVVVTAFYLAQFGMPGETLFGAVAMVVCLMALGADVFISASISVAEILRSSDTGQCRHMPLSPLELVQAVPESIIESWSESYRTGWSCLIHVLALAVKEQYPRATTASFGEPSDKPLCDDRFSNEFHYSWLELPCNSPRIGLLWASVQTELLTYRRVVEGDSWISEKLSMKALKTWLEDDYPEFSTPLVQNRMFKRHTHCGWFSSAVDFLCPNAEEVCTNYFMNMDIFDRASYIIHPGLLRSFESVEMRSGKGI